MIRPATVADTPDLARLHVQAWGESYAGLLPAAEIAARDIAARTAQWTSTIAAGSTRIMVLPGFGFAQTGAQRDPALAERYPQELLALYLLRSGQGRGHGRALLRAATDPARAMTALVLVGNDGALGFYTRTGAREIDRIDTHVGGAPITDVLIAWDDPAMI